MTYSEFKNGRHFCKACHQESAGRDFTVGEMFEEGQLCEYHCPHCDAYFGAIPWPLVGEDQR